MLQSRRAALSLIGLAVLAASGAASAQPAMVAIGMSLGGLTADGQSANGAIYDAGLAEYRVFKYTRGVGGLDTGGVYNDSAISMSADGTAMSWGAYNLENVGNFPGPGGTGSPTSRTIAHRWTSVTGSVNIGMASNGYYCDYNINGPNAISGNGRYVFCAGWTNNKICGTFSSWRYDSQTATFTQLPASFINHPPIRQAATAFSVWSGSFDGNVCCGYDQNYDAAYTQILRRATVWTNNGSTWTEIVLDPSGGVAGAVSPDGTRVAGTVSAVTGAADSPPSASFDLQLWTRVGTTSTWTRTTLGRPADRGLQATGGDGPLMDLGVIATSTDASTIMGYAGYLDPGYPLAQEVRRPFIWRASINNGVPIDLEDYVRSILPPGDTDFDNLRLGTGSAISADGNALTCGYTDSHSPCLTTGGNAILYLNGTTCEQPRVNFDPVSQPGATSPPGSFGVILNAFVSGSWPLHYQWQKEVATGVWQDLVDDNCDQFNSLNFDVKSATGSQLRLGSLNGIWQGVYRCKITNSCGSVTTGAATIGTPVIPSSCLPNLLTGSGCLGPVDLLQYLNLYFTNYDGHGSAVPGDNQTIPDLNPTSSIYAVPCTPSAPGEYPVIPASGLKADYDSDCQVGPTDLLSYLHDYFNPAAECFSGCGLMKAAPHASPAGKLPGTIVKEPAGASLKPVSAARR